MRAPPRMIAYGPKDHRRRPYQLDHHDAGTGVRAGRSIQAYHARQVVPAALLYQA
jgi:hypothetical protein